jgi:S-adenosylhomocysteine hydrolase
MNYFIAGSKTLVAGYWLVGSGMQGKFPKKSNIKMQKAKLKMSFKQNHPK